MLNLTQHPATPAQIAVGVVDAPAELEIGRMMTFDGLPSREAINARADLIAVVARNWIEVQNAPRSAMIGGAPWFMSTMERALKRHGIAPSYAFSQRASVEELQSDGSVRKTQIFRHAGMIPAS